MQSQRPSLFSSALSDDSSVSSGSDNDNDGASPRSSRFGSADRRKANSGMSGTAAMRQRLSEARAGASAAMLQPLTPVHRPPSPDAASTEFEDEYQLHTSLRHEPRAARLAHSLHGMAAGAASASSSATAAATSDAAAAPASSSSSSLFSSFRGAASHHASPYRSRLFHSLTNGGASAAPSHAGSAAPSALSSPTRNGGGGSGADPLRLYAPSQAQSLAGSPSRPSSNGSNGTAMAPAPDAFQLQQTVAQLRRQLAEQDSALAQERSRRLAAQSELNSSTSPGAARHAASNPTMESTFFNHMKSDAIL